MPPTVWLTTCDPTALRDLLHSQTARLTTAYLESESRAIFASLADFLTDPPRLPAGRWHIGRAFGSTLEIRWRMIDKMLIDVESLSEMSQPPDSLALRWTASEWNHRLDPTPRQREVLLIEPENGRAFVP